MAHERDTSLLLPGSSGKYITCYDPSTGMFISTRQLLSADGVAEQVQRADLAQRQWSKSSFAKRCSVLRSIKAWVLRDMDVIVDVACRDTGKTRGCFNLVANARRRCRLWRDSNHARKDRLADCKWRKGAPSGQASIESPAGAQGFRSTLPTCPAHTRSTMSHWVLSWHLCPGTTRSTMPFRRFWLLLWLATRLS